MYVVISSKYLANELSKIDFDRDSVRYISGEETSLTIDTYCCSLVLDAEISKKNSDIKQDDAKWHWVKSLVSVVEEQPIVLDISENRVDVIFQY